MKILVTGCNRCPFFDSEWLTCSHPSAEGGPQAEAELQEASYGYTPTGERAASHPYWCPLQQHGPVLIELAPPPRRLDKNAMEADAAMALGHDDDDDDSLPF